MGDRREDGRRLLIRAGTPDDAPFVTGLGVAAFARFGDYDPVLREFLASSDVTAWIAVVAGVRVGFALVERPPAVPALADLVAIAVDPACRRAGVGRALLARAVADIAACSEPVVLALTVAEDNDGAIGLFREFEFEFGLVPGAFGHYSGGQRSRRMVRVIKPRTP